MIASPICFKDEVTFPIYSEGIVARSDLKDFDGSALVNHVVRALGFPISAYPEVLSGLECYLAKHSATPVKKD